IGLVAGYIVARWLVPVHTSPPRPARVFSESGVRTVGLRLVAQDGGADLADRDRAYGRIDNFDPRYHYYVAVDQSGHWSIQGDELEPQGQEFGQDVDLGSLCRGTREGPPPCTVAVLMSPTTNITKGNLTNEVLQKRGVI